MNLRAPIVILLSAATILAIAMGIRNTFGLFLQPLSIDLALPREVFALSIAIQSLMWGASQPIFGAIADRFGAGRVALFGAVAYMGGLAVMAGAAGPLGLHVGAGLLVGIGLSATGFAVVLGPVGRAFPENKRSVALGIASSGGSFGQFAMAPIGGVLLHEFGWTSTIWIFVFIAVLIIPFALGVSGHRAVSSSESTQSLGEALTAARRHRGYWLLNAGFFVCGFHVTFILTHLPPFLADRAFSATLGATAIAIIGFFNFVGTFGAGWLGGRYRKKYVLSLYYLARGVVMLGFLLLPVTETTVIIFAGLIGLLWLGTVPLTSGLVAQIFGARNLGALFGIVFFSHQVGAFLGAWLGGRLYDMTGSYDQVWIMAIALAVFAALIHWPIADRPIAAEARAKP